MRFKLRCAFATLIGTALVFSVTYVLMDNGYSGDQHTFGDYRRPYMYDRIDIKPERYANHVNEKKMVSADEFRRNKSVKTGNPLIDDYGLNDIRMAGENGRGLIFRGKEKQKQVEFVQTLHVNGYASDLIPLNRMVPDSRPKSCASLKYRTSDLPTASVVVPFYNEWPSILLRTVYSIINRTPRHLLREIVLVDDGSDAENLAYLEQYIAGNFPVGLVTLLRLPARVGLIKARLAGWATITAEVVIFFDSHMEVNIDWIEPLLTEIAKDRKTVAMGNLDYIQLDSFEYSYYDNYMTRYVFDWRLIFFETFWRADQLHGKADYEPRIGPVMVGAAFAIDSEYFKEIGAYDDGMKIWGGENLELSWRVWMCGGKLVHLPCSHIGHIARTQPYDFPGGRSNIEAYNYKRAIEVWMEDGHKEFVFDYLPAMRKLSPGNLTSRLQIRERLHCKSFSWYLDTIWPELLVFNKDTTAWGSVRNGNLDVCLDNNYYLFQYEGDLFVNPCTHTLANQGFAMTLNNQLRTSLQCVIVTSTFKPRLADCIESRAQYPDTAWSHDRQTGHLVHVPSGKCLDVNLEQKPIMRRCGDASMRTQIWTFQHYVT